MYYGPNTMGKYFKDMSDRRLKKDFFGKHIDKYTGDVRPKCTMNETGINGRFGPLHNIEYDK